MSKYTAYLNSKYNEGKISLKEKSDLHEKYLKSSPDEKRRLDQSLGSEFKESFTTGPVSSHEEGNQIQKMTGLQGSLNDVSKFSNAANIGLFLGIIASGVLLYSLGIGTDFNGDFQFNWLGLGLFALVLALSLFCWASFMVLLEILRNISQLSKD